MTIKEGEREEKTSRFASRHVTKFTTILYKHNVCELQLFQLQTFTCRCNKSKPKSLKSIADRQLLTDKFQKPSKFFASFRSRKQHEPVKFKSSLQSILYFHAKIACYFNLLSNFHPTISHPTQVQYSFSKIFPAKLVFLIWFIQKSFTTKSS